MFLSSFGNYFNQIAPATDTYAVRAHNALTAS